MKWLKQLLSREEQSGDSTAGDLAAHRFDPFDASFVVDPYPLFRYLREHDPVHRSEQGAWVITGYQDILDALADRRLGNAPSPYAVVNPRNRSRYVCADVATNILPFLDIPAHTRPRKLVARVFSEQLKRRPPPLQSIALELLESLRQRGEMELLADFATPYSVQVMIELLGIPHMDAPRLKRWSEDFFYLFSIIPSEQIRQQLDQALMEFRDYFAQQVALRHGQSGDDLISALMLADDDGYRLGEAEIIDTLMLLFADGVENVDSMIANALAALLQNPEQLALLKAQPQLLSQAVDECLRYESPAQFVGRVALEDMELRGVKITKGSGVLLVIGAANRDSRQFANADSLDITRSPNPHLSFGKGKHACIGGPLVRQEVEQALAVLLANLPDLAQPQPELQWQQRLGHRWLQRLPLAFNSLGNSSGK